MKFHWGTGITIFIFLFLGMSAVFIAFAMRQDIDLVHEDYYERGVDHTSQMEVEERSAVHAHEISTSLGEEHLLIRLADSLALQIDSASFLLYRPSDSRLDRKGSFDPRNNPLALPLNEMTGGRYVLIFEWYSGGLRHETQQSLTVP